MRLRGVKRSSFRLMPVSPIHVGSGDSQLIGEFVEVGGEAEFVELVRLDLPRLFSEANLPRPDLEKFLKAAFKFSESSDARGGSVEAEEILLRSLRRVLKFRPEFKEKFGGKYEEVEEKLREWLAERYGVGRVRVPREEYPRLKGLFSWFAFVRSGGFPYVPGSSLKGLFNSALLFRVFREGRGSGEAVLKELGKFFSELSKRPRERSVNLCAWETGCGKRNGNCPSVFHLYGVGDSSPIDPGRTVVRLSRRTGGREKGVPEAFEVYQPADDDEGVRVEVWFRDVEGDFPSGVFGKWEKEGRELVRLLTEGSAEERLRRVLEAVNDLTRFLLEDEVKQRERADGDLLRDAREKLRLVEAGPGKGEYYGFLGKCKGKMRSLVLERKLVKTVWVLSEGEEFETFGFCKFAME